MFLFFSESISSSYLRMSNLSRNAVATYFPLANICALSTSPLVSTFSPSIAILRAIAPRMFTNRTPIVCIQHINFFLEALFVLRVSLVALANNMKRQRIVWYATWWYYVSSLYLCNKDLTLFSSYIRFRSFNVISHISCPSRRDRR